MANNSIRAAFERMWQHVTLALSNKADKDEISNIVFQCYRDDFSLGDRATFTPLSSTTPPGKTAKDIFMMNFVDTNGIIYTAVRKTITDDIYGSGEFRFNGTGATSIELPKVGWGTLRLGYLSEGIYYTELVNTYCATIGTGGMAVTKMNLSGMSQIIIYYK